MKERGPGAGEGHITREWTVWCYSCAHWYQCGTENTLKGAIRDFRAYGWLLVKGKWYCSVCKRDGK